MYESITLMGDEYVNESLTGFWLGTNVSNTIIATRIKLLHDIMMYVNCCETPSDWRGCLHRRAATLRKAYAKATISPTLFMPPIAHN